MQASAPDPDALAPAPPWDPPPLTTAAKVRLGLGTALLALAAFLLTAGLIAGLIMFLAHYTWSRFLPWGGLAILAGVVLLLTVLLILALRGLAALRWRLRLSQIEAACHTRGAWYYGLPAAFWRQIHGPVDLLLGPADISVSGFLGPDLVVYLLLMALGFAAGHICVAAGVPNKALLGLAPYFLAVLYQCRAKKATIRVRDANVAGLQCRGPVVTLLFRKPPVRRLTRIALYMRSDARRDFFEECRRRWPDLLPEAYHAALDRP